MSNLRTIFLALLLPAMTGTVMAADPLVVVIKDFKFQPQEVTVKKGSTIRWENREKRQYHSVWFQQAGDPEPEYFFPEESYERHFDTVGDFPYRCGPHPYMTGTVHVTD